MEVEMASAVRSIIALSLNMQALTMVTAVPAILGKLTTSGLKRFLFTSMLFNAALQIAVLKLSAALVKHLKTLSDISVHGEDFHITISLYKKVSIFPPCHLYVIQMHSDIILNHVIGIANSDEEGILSEIIH